MKYPEELYPTVVEGVIYGPVRCESLDGSEMYLTTPDEVTVFKNFKPFMKDGKMWAVTHLQKKSRKGWLKMSPQSYHRWWFWKLQEQDEQGNWKPGTERGIYFRKPFSWRWDVASTNGKHWIWTFGFLGGHWD